MPLFLSVKTVLLSAKTIKIVSSGLVILVTSYFLTDAIPDLASNNDLSNDWILNAYRSLEKARRGWFHTGVYTNNYLYPYIHIKSMGDLPLITHNYIGKNLVPGLELVGSLGTDIPKELAGQIRASLECTDIVYIHRTALDSFDVSQLRYTDADRSKMILIEWYLGWKDMEGFEFYRQLFVNPQDDSSGPLIFKVCELVIHANTILDGTPSSTPIGPLSTIAMSEIEHEISANLSNRVLITPDKLAIVDFLRGMSMGCGLTLEETVTIFSQNVIHLPEGAKPDLLALNFPSGGDYRDLITPSVTPSDSGIPSDSSSGWYVRFALVFVTLSVAALGAAYYTGAL